MEKSALKSIWKVIKIFVFILLAIILTVNISIIIQAKINPDKVPGVFGYKPFIVLSASMEAKINVGDLIIVKDIDARDLKVGDIIAFRTKDNLVTTHRITEIIEKEGKLQFATKGDNNNVEDQDLTSQDAIEGKYYTKFEKIGNIILFIQQPIGFTAMMMIIFILCIIIYSLETRSEDKLKD